MKRILLAESPEVMPMALEALGCVGLGDMAFGLSVTGQRLSVVPCTSLQAAKRAVFDSVDGVLCGLHFDDSRMFDFLRFMKAEPALKCIPFLCIKTLEGTLDPVFYQSVTIATRALGAAGFFDLAALNQELGRTAALEKVGKCIDHMILDVSY